MLPVHKLLSFSKYPAHAYFPITYYIDGEGNVSESPELGWIKVESYVLPFGSEGLVVEVVGGRGVAVRAYRIDECVVEDSRLVEHLTSRIIEAYNEYTDPGLPLDRKHVVKGLSMLLGVPEEEIDEYACTARARRLVEDRNVAIIGDTVLVLSKTRILVRVPGTCAARVARRYGFPVDSPITAIAEHIERTVGRRPTIYAFRYASIICNRRECYYVQLPARLARPVARRLRTILVEPPAEPDTKLPPPPVCFTREKAIILEQEDGDTYRITRHIDAPSVTLPMPTAYTDQGKRTCIFTTNKVKLVPIIEDTENPRLQAPVQPA